MRIQKNIQSHFIIEMWNNWIIFFIHIFMQLYKFVFFFFFSRWTLIFYVISAVCPNVSICYAIWTWSEETGGRIWFAHVIRKVAPRAHAVREKSYLALNANYKKKNWIGMSPRYIKSALRGSAVCNFVSKYSMAKYMHGRRDKIFRCVFKTSRFYIPDGFNLQRSEPQTDEMDHRFQPPPRPPSNCVFDSLRIPY